MFAAIAEKIIKAEKVAIFNHEHPDGDALGSAYALKLMFVSMGKQAEVYLRDNDENIKEFGQIKTGPGYNLKINECDLKIAVDCADFDRIGTLKSEFCGNTAAIDHHVTHSEFAEVSIVVPEAAATGEIIYDLIEYMGVELSYDMAHNLYVAIACDSGSFKYSSTTPKTHMIAAELLKAGIDVADISKSLFDTNSFEYLKAYKEGIERLELFLDGKVAVLTFNDEDFNRAGISEDQASGLVNLPRSIEGVMVGVYIRQRDGVYKVSLRSNSDIDVARIAADFGGGGHVKASGFSLNMPIEEVKLAVVMAIKKVL